MKKKLFRLLILGFLFGILVFSAYAAQNAPSGLPPRISKLPGDDIKVEDGILKSDVVCAGQITDLGYPNPGATDMVSYRAKIEIIQTLMGSISSPILAIIKIDGGKHEDSPINGVSYVFFIKKMPVTNKVLKLLPATDANIAKVKALIAAAPVSK
jgi:hypothetical protein